MPELCLKSGGEQQKGDISRGLIKRLTHQLCGSFDVASGRHCFDVQASGSRIRRVESKATVGQVQRLAVTPSDGKEKLRGSGKGTKIASLLSLPEQRFKGRACLLVGSADRFEDPGRQPQLEGLWVPLESRLELPGGALSVAGAEGEYG